MIHPTESVDCHGGMEEAIRLVVDQTTNDDSAIVFLHPNTMEKLHTYAGHTLLLEGKNGKHTICIVKCDGSCEEQKIRMNRVTRENLRVRLGDVVSLCQFRGVEHGAYVVVQPLADTIRGLPCDDLFNRLTDHFMNKFRPVTEGDHFLVRGQMKCVEFKVFMTIPGESCIVGPFTNILCQGTPLSRKYEDRLNEVGYDDVGGLGEQIAQIHELVDLPLRRPWLLEYTDLMHPRGILLYGPAGSGKRLIAQAVANENDAFFLVLEGKQIVCTKAGEETMRTTFAKAAENGRSIIFIDDIDLITPKWGNTQGGVEMMLVSQLLTLMDGLKSSPQVIVIGASNRPDNIDPALKRFGRFEREISIFAPDEVGRLEVLKIHTKNMRLSPDVDLKQIAKDTHGFVGSDLAALCNEAALQSIRETNEVTSLKDGSVNVELLNSIAISPQHFNTALETTRRCAMPEILVGSPNVSLSDIEAPQNAESKLPEAEVPTVTWQDIGGLENVKKEIKENVQYPMEYPEMFEIYGLSPAKGVLLYGPPGCGKTLIAMATAHECNARFISIKGPEMLTPWLGDSEANIRKTFDEARKSAPCIIFFDEIDSIGFMRGSHPGDGDAAARILNQLLTEMDGINAQKNIFVIGATNRPEILDHALIRPGRFDRLIYIPLPDESSRHQIFGACLRKSPLDADVDLLALAKRTQGYSGADIKEICHRAMKSAMLEEIERREARDENLDWTDEEDGEDELVKINPSHFVESIKSARRSVTDADLRKYEAFARALNPPAFVSQPTFGASGAFSDDDLYN